ncbi:BgTH12-06816 [Blumeria graminis f. sp. triticale]|uniref:Protein ROT1 n=1 Tax=Blumeria graminis f. sp. triticale TaxID=1689686 RepID=A0A9W4GHP8_BLUGR|nr:BgTH12-06816 [Blumeria graminis f. sp. triticale]
MKFTQTFLSVGLVAGISAVDIQLVGTWASKSGSTLTGPSFYNPVNDVFIEPSHTGISYSFTEDGFYEEAYYRAVSNPTKPSCPKAILQFQHGTFTQNSDGSLSLTPFADDGRQLQSDPCANRHSLYTRYNQSETMQKYQLSIDSYTKMKRLDLYQFDGTPVVPLYLAYSPPQMLPTITMNPVAKTNSKNRKRSIGSTGQWESIDLPLNKHATHIRREIRPSLIHTIDPSLMWWGGIAMTIFGGAAYLL